MSRISTVGGPSWLKSHVALAGIRRVERKKKRGYSKEGLGLGLWEVCGSRPGALVVSAVGCWGMSLCGYCTSWPMGQRRGREGLGGELVEVLALGAGSGGV